MGGHNGLLHHCLLLVLTRAPLCSILSSIPTYTILYVFLLNAFNREYAGWEDLRVQMETRPGEIFNVLSHALCPSSVIITITIALDF